MKAAIQGIRGSYSEQAAKEMLGLSVEIVECRSFSEAVTATADSMVDFAVLPLRNRIVGNILAVHDLIEAQKVSVVGESRLAIHHLLLGTADSTMGEITSVRSHPEAIKQCRRFFRSNPQITANEGPDTASSVRAMVGEGYRHSAAIGSSRAAELYGAKVLSDAIADEKDNWTVFGLVRIGGNGSCMT